MNNTSGWHSLKWFKGFKLDGVNVGSVLAHCYREKWCQLYSGGGRGCEGKDIQVNEQPRERVI